jgi:hypothetical protein
MRKRKSLKPVQKYNRERVDQMNSMHEDGECHRKFKFIEEIETENPRFVSEQRLGSKILTQSENQTAIKIARGAK